MIFASNLAPATATSLLKMRYSNRMYKPPGSVDNADASQLLLMEIFCLATKAADSVALDILRENVRPANRARLNNVPCSASNLSSNGIIDIAFSTK